MSSIVLINWLTYPSMAPSLIIWALADKILIFGAWAISHILLQIWIGLSLLIVGVSFACQGFWQVTVFSSIYALILIFVINLVQNVTQEQTRLKLINFHIKKDTKPIHKKSLKARFRIRSQSVMLPRRPTREVDESFEIKDTFQTTILISIT